MPDALFGDTIRTRTLRAVRDFIVYKQRGHCVRLTHCLGRPPSSRPIYDGYLDEDYSTATADTPLRGVALGPSLPLFCKLYRERCIAFDHMWGWEARRYDRSAWWSAVPPDVRPRLTFINRPIRVGKDLTDDPLLVIARTATREDFVVLKLDVDMFSLERELVREILTNERGTNASFLIDELFFEYHFWTSETSPDNGGRRLHRYWGDEKRRGTVVGGTVDDALGIMQGLRVKGVRTHFWI